MRFVATHVFIRYLTNDIPEKKEKGIEEIYSYDPHYDKVAWLVRIEPRIQRQCSLVSERKSDKSSSYGNGVEHSLNN